MPLSPSAEALSMATPVAGSAGYIPGADTVDTGGALGAEAA
ncbi:hypothetical protein [Sorangium sp. So ce131]